MPSMKNHLNLSIHNTYVDETDVSLILCIVNHHFLGNSLSYLVAFMASTSYRGDS